MTVDPKNISNADIYKLLININDQNIEINRRLERIEDNYKQEINLVKDKLELLETENTEIKKQLMQLQKQLKKYNIVIYGVNETETELKQFMVNLITNQLELNIPSSDIRDIYRIGKKDSGKVRPIIVELLSYDTKLDILRRGKKLKGTGLYVCPDLIPQELEDRKVLVEQLKLAREKQLSAKIVNSKLIVNGETYNAKQLRNNVIFTSTSETIEATTARQVNSAPSTPTRQSVLDCVFYNIENSYESQQTSEQDREKENSSSELINSETVAERVLKKRKKTMV